MSPSEFEISTPRWSKKDDDLQNWTYIDASADNFEWQDVEKESSKTRHKMESCPASSR